MSLATDRVYQGDCVQLLRDVDERSVDLVFADPPFNIGYDYDVYDDRREADDYLAWSRTWIEAVKRVLKPDGAFWLAIGDDFAAELKVLCTRDLGFHCRSWVVWFYTFGVHCKNKFTRSHTHLFHFVKDPKKVTFNSLDVRVPSARELVYGDKRADPHGRVPDDTWMISPALPPDVPTKDGFILRPQDIPERFPPHSDTWFFSRVAGTFNERRGWHGCQMPEQLLGRIIRACSDEGDLVLDPFAGSGTTLAAAKKLNRRFLGFELSEEYARNVETRLASIQSGDALTGPENAVASAPRTPNGRVLERTGQPVKRPAQTHAAGNGSLSGRSTTFDHELGGVIAKAFEASHCGYSADRVLADPSLDDRFIENCRRFGMPGEPKDWNHLLLNVRKRGGLAGIPTTRADSLARAALDPFIFASEIAWHGVTRTHACTLDDILCNPVLACEFDHLASRIAPGHTPFEYRWGALSVRKEASKGAELLKRVTFRLPRPAFGLRDHDGLPCAPGSYVILLEEVPFFVGATESLRDCPFFDPARVLAAYETIGGASASESAFTIRVPVFSLESNRTSVPWRAARRAKLLSRFNPSANLPFPQHAA